MIMRKFYNRHTGVRDFSQVDRSAPVCFQKTGEAWYDLLFLPYCDTNFQKCCVIAHTDDMDDTAYTASSNFLIQHTI